MSINRRRLLGSAALGVSSLAAATTKLPDFTSIRSEFPRATQQVYLDAAANMPLPKFVAEGMRRYMDFHMYGPGEGRGDYASKTIREVKPLFARLINAKPSEIGFVVCTKAGEAAVINGLRIQESGGNLVTNDLHYAGSIHDYIGRRQAGLDVRIVGPKVLARSLVDVVKRARILMVVFLVKIKKQFNCARRRPAARAARTRQRTIAPHRQRVRQPNHRIVAHNRRDVAALHVEHEFSAGARRLRSARGWYECLGARRAQVWG